MAAIVARRVCKRAAVRTMLADMIRADASACSGKNRIGFSRRARTRRHAAWPKSMSARGLPREIGFAPEMIAGDHAAHFHSHTAEADMTAYLISLALVGLVVIALSEGFS